MDHGTLFLHELGWTPRASVLNLDCGFGALDLWLVSHECGHLIETLPFSCGEEVHAFPSALRKGRDTVDGRNPAPLWNHPLFVDIDRGIMMPGFLRWCRISSIHSMFGLCQSRSLWSAHGPALFLDSCEALPRRRGLCEAANRRGVSMPLVGSLRLPQEWVRKVSSAVLTFDRSGWQTAIKERMGI